MEATIMFYSPDTLSRRAGMLAAWAGVLWPLGILCGALSGFAIVNGPNVDAPVILLSSGVGAFIGVTWAAIMWSYLQVKALTAARLAEMNLDVSASHEGVVKRAVLTSP